MSLSVQFTPLFEVQADWLIVGVFEEEVFAMSLAALDGRLAGALSRLRQGGDIGGKANELTPLLDCQGTGSPRLLIVGLGKRGSADRAALGDAAATAARFVTDKPRKRVAFALPENVEGIGWSELALTVGVGLMRGCQGPGVRKTEPSRYVPDELWLIAPPQAPAEELQHGTRRAAVEGKAVALARELVNMPPCDLYPESLAELARQVAGGAGIDCSVLQDEQLEAERLRALLAVARGSDRPPRLVVLRYRGAPPSLGGEAPPLLGLVGKGVTFDSGGLSLKTNEQMLDMKSDMAGAATVLTAISAIAELRLPVDVLGVLALVENMPGPKAMKLGDVIQSRNGTTIEVLNTDAEGRLILADALAYAVDHGATRLVDLATLTGACMIALGEHVAGLMGNNDAWLNRIESAAQRAGERLWRLPMWPLYAERLKSDVADVKNVTGKRYGGAITAAKFLEKFVGNVPWAHLDIAGPSWAESASAAQDSGGTGAFVRTLVELASELK
jgi:leucyl aminopeptidase